MRVISLLPFAIVLLLLCACGGGSGDGGGGGGGVSTISRTYTRSDGGAAPTEAAAVATLPGGACLVAGRFAGTATFGAGQPAQTQLTAAGSFDLFVARYAGNGSLVWVRRAGGTLLDDARALTAFPDGACIVTGFFKGTATFGPGEPNATTLDDVDDLGDIFVARYEPDGSLAWAKRAGRDGADIPAGIAGFPDGSCVVTGSFNTIATFGSGEPGLTVLSGIGDEVFVARFNADGTLAWAKRAGGTLSDVGTGVATFADGSLVVTGYFEASGIFAPGEPQQQALTSAGILDAFVARYDGNGTLLWARQAGGADYEEGLGIAAAPDGTCVVTGFFRGDSVFGPGEANQTMLTSFASSNDVFVARYDAGGALLWARGAGGGGADAGWSIAAFDDGSSVVAGHFGSVAVFGQDEPGEAFLVTEGGADAFLAKYAADGHLQWVRSAGGSGTDYGHGAAIHADGTIGCCGEFVDTMIFSPGEAWAEPIFSGGSRNLFLARYNANGTL